MTTRKLVYKVARKDRDISRKAARREKLIERILFQDLEVNTKLAEGAIYSQLPNRETEVDIFGNVRQL